MAAQREVSARPRMQIVRHAYIWQARLGRCAVPTCPRLARQMWHLTPYCQRHYQERKQRVAPSVV